MARPKKEGEKISLLLEKDTANRIRAYADKHGQTLTMAIERAINGYLDARGEPTTKDKAEQPN